MENTVLCELSRTPSAGASLIFIQEHIPVKFAKIGNFVDLLEDGETFTWQITGIIHE